MGWGGVHCNAKSLVIAANEGHPHITKPENPAHDLLHLTIKWIEMDGVGCRTSVALKKG